MSNTSVKPADNNSITGILKTIQDRTSRNIENMLPCKVINFNRTLNRVTVQPLIRVLGSNGEIISRNQIASIPVYNPSGGGFGVYFPLVQGNLGWIIANDRDISLFMQSYSESKPNTTRKHSFSDAVFYPDMMTGYSIDAEDATNLTIQNLNATVKVTLGVDTVKLKATNILFESTSLTHNGINIGDTHTHQQGPDSAGNTEQNTGTPI
jgi:hypothetical protein